MTSLLRFLTSSYFGLLVSLVSMLILSSLIQSSDSVRLFQNAIFSIIIFYGFWIVQRKRGLLILIFLFGLPAFVLRWYVYSFSSTPDLQSIGLVLNAFFFLCLTAFTIQDVLSSTKVTVDTLFGAITAYFLIGFFFTYLYMLTYGYNSLAFSFPSDGLVQNFAENQSFEFLYFSFVSLTTLGFGDIAPVSSFARVITIVEAVIGQMFAAVLIARLVGLSIAEYVEEK